MNSWSQQLEADLKWREAELGSLKITAATAAAGSDRQRALLRALWTMLYAHYEGFSKFCWDLLLDQIEKERCMRADAIDPVAIFSLEKAFKAARNGTNKALWQFITATFPAEMRQALSFPVRLDTRSNLWPSISIENNEAVGLKCKQIKIHEAQIKALVRRRNEIAHGRKLVVANLLEYETYEKAVMIVLHELAVSVVEHLVRRTFVKSGASDVAGGQLSLPFRAD